MNRVDKDGGSLVLPSSLKAQCYLVQGTSQQQQFPSVELLTTDKKIRASVLELPKINREK